MTGRRLEHHAAEKSVLMHDDLNENIANYQKGKKEKLKITQTK